MLPLPLRKSCLSSPSNTARHPTRLRLPAALLASASVCCGLFATGCVQHRAVLVHPTKDVMMLAEPVKAKVYVYRNGQWLKSGNRVVIPSGYYILYDDQMDSKGD